MALLAIVAFTVGIGSATAIFTVINGVMLKPLPYPTRRALRRIFTAPGSTSRAGIPPAHFPISSSIRPGRRASTSSAGSGSANFNLTSPGEPQYLSGAASPRRWRGTSVCRVSGQWFTDERGRGDLDRALDAAWQRPEHRGKADHARRSSVHDYRRDARRIPLPDRGNDDRTLSLPTSGSTTTTSSRSAISASASRWPTCPARAWRPR